MLTEIINHSNLENLQKTENEVLINYKKQNYNITGTEFVKSILKANFKYGDLMIKPEHYNSIIVEPQYNTHHIITKESFFKIKFLHFIVYKMLKQIEYDVLVNNITVKINDTYSFENNYKVVKADLKKKLRPLYSEIDTPIYVNTQLWHGHVHLFKKVNNYKIKLCNFKMNNLDNVKQYNLKYNKGEISFTENIKVRKTYIDDYVEQYGNYFNNSEKLSLFLKLVFDKLISLSENNTFKLRFTSAGLEKLTIHSKYDFKNKSFSNFKKLSIFAKIFNNEYNSDNEDFEKFAYFGLTEDEFNCIENHNIIKKDLKIYPLLKLALINKTYEHFFKIPFVFKFNKAVKKINHYECSNIQYVYQRSEHGLRPNEHTKYSINRCN